MILNTGSRTDIPAFYADWFYNRVKEGYVLVRNPYDPAHITEYVLNPEAVDVLSFCTKNPQPMLKRIEELNAFRQFWQVTVTPYGKDIEPYVPDKWQVLESIRELSDHVGKQCVFWRYDPIVINEKYTEAYHLQAFEKIASYLKGYVSSCVVSFVDLYGKTKQNFPEVHSVPYEVQLRLVEKMSVIAKENGIEIRLCCESASLKMDNVYTDGCMSKEVLEKAFGFRLRVPSGLNRARKECTCLLGADIGVYGTCLHACRYCYANDDRQSVVSRFRKHDPSSPLLVGKVQEGDIITKAHQVSWIDHQLSLF